MMGGGRFSSVRVAVGESDLWLGWVGGRDPASPPCAPSREPDGALVAERAESLLRSVRAEIRARISADPAFLSSLSPLPPDPEAKRTVRAMLDAAAAADVGPMAAVAGAIAQEVGEGLHREFGFAELVVENGGDFWLNVREPLAVAVYAGLSSLSLTFAVMIPPELCPCGLACSSGTVGPSLSFGKADAAIVVASSAAAADAWATALGNRVKYRDELESAVTGIISARPSDPLLAPLGALAVMADRFAAAGSIRLAPLPDRSASDSIRP